MLERFIAIAQETCSRWGATLLECNGEPDHIHLLIDYPPDVSISKFVANLKTVTSRLLRKEFPQLQRTYSKPVLWTGSYFVASCGGVTIEQLKHYVENQRTE